MNLKRFMACVATAVVLASASASMGITVAAAKALPAGSVVTIEGLIITQTFDTLYSTNSKSFQAEDATGGVTVYGVNADVDAVLAGRAIGDRINLTGKTSLFKGVFELGTPFTSTYVDHPGAPAPAPITIADMQDLSPTAEGFESRVVKLSNVKFTSTGTFVGGGSVYLSADGTSTGQRVQVYITGDTNTPNPLQGLAIPQGFVNFTGFVMQNDTAAPYDSYYEIVPFASNAIEELSPAAIAGNSVTVKNAARYTITLQGSAIGGGTLTYKIKQTADRMFPDVDHGLQGGTLYLPGTTTPVTIDATLPGNTVDFEPATDVSGWYQFKFATAQTGYADAEATVDVFIQDPGKVVITEIMYQPLNGSASKQFDWEYVEITNVSGSPITLDTLFDARLRLNPGVEHNLANASDYGTPAIDASIIPAGATQVIAENNGYRSTAQFLNEWNPGAGDATYPATGGDPSKIQRQNFMVLDYASSSGAVATPALDDTGDTLILLDVAGNCLDVVKYENGTNGWPTSNNYGSIFLESNKINVVDNDNGANWRLSATSVANSNAYMSVETFGLPVDSNVGSPALIPTQTTATFAATPTATYQALDGAINQGTTTYTSILLTGTDPNSLPLTYKITSLVQGLAPTTSSGGELKNSSLADVTVGATLVDGQLFFKPGATMTGRYALQFVANNGSADSPPAYVALQVQGHSNRIVISEIMYNPYNDATLEWEWVEVKNLTSADVALHSLIDGNDQATPVTDTSVPGNLIGITVPANGTRVLARAIASPVSPYSTEWFNPNSIANTVFIPDARWPALNNGNVTGKSFADKVLLFAADGELLDAISYGTAAPWPVDPNSPAIYAGHSSIYFTPGTLDTFANDNGANWAYSVAGTAGAYATANGLDFGSPGIGKSLIFDFNNDGAVDVTTDLPVFVGCASGPAVARTQSADCAKADYDSDNDVDMADYSAFQRCLQPTSVTPPAECLR